MPAGLLKLATALTATLLVESICNGAENGPIDGAPVTTAVSLGLEQPTSAHDAAKEDIASLVDTVRGEFRPVPPEELDAARRSAVESLAKLDTYLRRYKTGASWQKYLRLSEVRALLAPGATPTVAKLSEAANRFASGYRGLESKQFRAPAVALDRYLRLRRVADDQGISVAFHQRLDQVTANLDKALAGDVDALTALGDALGWLDERGLAPQVTAAVRRKFAAPNLVVQASEALFAAGLTEQVDTVEPVREQIMGASVSGTGRTIGELKVHPLADPTRALFDAEFLGVNRSRTVAAQRSARIAGRGYTTLEAHKRLRFTPEGIVSGPAKATACLDTQTTCVWSTAPRLRGRIVTRVARRRSAESKPQAERIGSSRAADKLELRLDRQAGERLAKANVEYWKNVRRPLVAHGLFPRIDLLHTTASHVELIGMTAGMRQLGAPMPPPGIAQSRDLVARLHESAVNNLAQGLLAGETIKSEEVEAKLGEAGVTVPPPRRSAGEEGDEEEEESQRKGKWSITFADQGPVEARFRDGGFRITIRGRRFTSQANEFEQERTYPNAMVVWADYKIEQGPDGPRARRVGDIHALPPDVLSGKRPSMSTRETALVSMLTRENRMGNVLRKELGDEPFALPGRWKDAGELAMRELSADGGWLAASWELIGPAPDKSRRRVASAPR
ncbi:MAG: hypothetical protein K2Y37_19590 [Pirellulales bacterium]|nr:hypothetical protein [Pirellulales bacterium]